MANTTVADYLIQRLHEVGIRHIFSVPGDYIAGFLDAVDSSALIERVGTNNELVAGYAADGYARVNGAGAAAVTYGTGAFTMLNAVAGSYVESVPVIVINGIPTPAEVQLEKGKGLLLHHSTGNLQADNQIYSQVTNSTYTLLDVSSAPAQIDAAVAAAIVSQAPVYLEASTTVFTAACPAPAQPLDLTQPPSDPQALHDAVQAAWTKIESAKSPVLWCGLTVGRRKLQTEFLDLVSASGMPYIMSLQAKSVVSELLPQFAGIFYGSPSPPATMLQDSDCLIAIGVLVSDFEVHLLETKFDQMIVVDLGEVRIGDDTYEDVTTRDFLHALAVQSRTAPPRDPPSIPLSPAVVASPGDAITFGSLTSRLAGFLDDSMILLADEGFALYCTADLKVPQGGYICQCAWSAIGYATPSALGVGFASPSKRAVVVAGDGGFQMTAQAFGTMVRYAQRAIVFVLDNGTYGFEQFVLGGGFFTGKARILPYNELERWDYRGLAESMGGRGFQASTVGELDDVLKEVRDVDKPCVVQVRLSDKNLPVNLTPNAG
jgi:indolepyruvate decarboxylase